MADNLGNLQKNHRKGQPKGNKDKKYRSIHHSPSSAPQSRNSISGLARYHCSLSLE